MVSFPLDELVSHLKQLGCQTIATDCFQQMHYGCSQSLDLSQVKETQALRMELFWGLPDRSNSGNSLRMGLWRSSKSILPSSDFHSFESCKGVSFQGCYRLKRKVWGQGD